MYLHILNNHFIIFLKYKVKVNVIVLKAFYIKISNINI